MDSIYIFAFILAGIGFVLPAIGFGFILKDLLFTWEMNRIGRKLRKEYAEKYGRG